MGVVHLAVVTVVTYFSGLHGCMLACSRPQLGFFGCFLDKVISSGALVPLNMYLGATMQAQDIGYLLYTTGPLTSVWSC